jgi:hypothetical protein
MMSFEYLAEALFFLGVLIWLVRWIGRTMLEISGSERSGGKRESTDVRLERLFQESGAASYIAAHQAPAGVAQSRPSATTMTVHCPACGAPLTDVPARLPIMVDCSACGRRVNVRGDGPNRFTVFVTEQRKTGAA